MLFIRVNAFCLYCISCESPLLSISIEACWIVLILGANTSNKFSSTSENVFSHIFCNMNAACIYLMYTYIYIYILLLIIIPSESLNCNSFIYNYLQDLECPPYPYHFSMPFDELKSCTEDFECETGEKCCYWGEQQKCKEGLDTTQHPGKNSIPYSPGAYIYWKSTHYYLLDWAYLIHKSRQSTVKDRP